MYDIIDAPVLFPYLDLSTEALDTLTVADEPTRFDAVKRLFETHEISFNEVPEVWTKNPLSAWSWLVLKINGIDPGSEHRPLINWGIDVAFASTPVRAFVWAIA